jgi:hypothetical protein
MGHSLSQVLQRGSEEAGDLSWSVVVSSWSISFSGQATYRESVTFHAQMRLTPGNFFVKGGQNVVPE